MASILSLPQCVKFRDLVDLILEDLQHVFPGLSESNLILTTLNNLQMCCWTEAVDNTVPDIAYLPDMFAHFTISDVVWA